MIKFYSLYEEDLLIFEDNILIFEELSLIFEDVKPYNILIHKHLKHFLYIILFRGNLLLTAICWKEEISRH